MNAPSATRASSEILILGIISAGMAASAAIVSTAVRYPRPVEFEAASDADSNGREMRRAHRVITREDEEERGASPSSFSKRPPRPARALTRDEGERTRVWSPALSHLGSPVSAKEFVLLRHGNLKTFFPYLVGSYSLIASELRRYISLGFRTFILDFRSRDDLAHIMEVFRRPWILAANPV